MDKTVTRESNQGSGPKFFVVQSAAGRLAGVWDANALSHYSITIDRLGNETFSSRFGPSSQEEFMLSTMGLRLRESWDAGARVRAMREVGLALATRLAQDCGCGSADFSPR